MEFFEGKRLVSHLENLPSNLRNICLQPCLWLSGLGYKEQGFDTQASLGLSPGSATYSSPEPRVSFLTPLHPFSPSAQWVQGSNAADVC